MMRQREGTRRTEVRAFACLDGVRALAATCVFVFHVGLRSPALLDHGMSWISVMDFGVEIFFVVSGFLIYRPYAASHLGEQPAPELRAYARRRLLRIFPAYLVALVILRATGEIGMNSWHGYLKHLSLTHTYFADSGGLGMKVSWTLVIELSFYAFVPVWAFGMRLVAKRAPALTVELVGALALIGVGFASLRWVILGHPPAWAMVLPPSFAALGIGMLLAVISVAQRESGVASVSRALGRIPAGIWWAAAAVLFIGIARLPLGYGLCAICRSPNDLVTANWLQSLFAACVVIPAVFGDPQRGLVRRSLRWRPVAYVGVVSYGVYLWHVYVIRLIPGSLMRDGLPPALLALAGAFAVTVAVASISYYVVERPAMRLARRPIRTWLHPGTSVER